MQGEHTRATHNTQDEGHQQVSVQYSGMPLKQDKKYAAQIECKCTLVIFTLTYIRNHVMQQMNNSIHSTQILMRIITTS